MIIGYARVSTKDQNIQTQIDLLKKAGCDKIFSDVASGVREDRNGLKDMISHIRQGDIVMVYKIDRIFRSLRNLVTLIDTFNSKKVQFKSLSDPAFDTTSSNGKFLLQIFGAVAEFERNLIRERTRAGLVNARKRKKLLGRPKGATQETIKKYHYANHIYNSQNVPIDEACKSANISKTTFYRVEKQLDKKNR